MKKLNILSYNIHKGFNLHGIRSEIRKLDLDIIFLQEVRGSFHKSPLKQFEFLAHEIWPHFSYGKNAVYEKGDHGNAILSRYPIISTENKNISVNRLERRGLLHAIIKPGKSELHLFCTHLDLFEQGRSKQLLKLVEFINLKVPQDEPVLLAGDFNDWRENAHFILNKKLGLNEVFLKLNGECAKTFPSFFPLLRLDRVYFRGLKGHRAQQLFRPPWTSLSDHLPLKAEFTFA